MEELRRKIKEIVPQERVEEVDRIFSEWIVGLKVHTIPVRSEALQERGEAGGGKEGKTENSLRFHVEELKRQIAAFKEKMKAYKASSSSTTELALADVKQEIVKVRQEISKLRLRFASPEGNEEKLAENAELLEKLDEVKQFLEKLK